LISWHLVWTVGVSGCRTANVRSTSRRCLLFIGEKLGESTAAVCVLIANALLDGGLEPTSISVPAAGEAGPISISRGSAVFVGSEMILLGDVMCLGILLRFPTVFQYAPSSSEFCSWPLLFLGAAGCISGGIFSWTYGGMIVSSVLSVVSASSQRCFGKTRERTSQRNGCRPSAQKNP